jgi:molybdopterin-guanine dinucleotide biosynthesis protein A
MTAYPRDEITAVILAGGRARRMGGQDKGLIEVSGRPMIDYVLEVLVPQVGHIVINANRNCERYASYGYPVIGDEIRGFQGPLAGIVSSMADVETPYLLTAPCDSPFLPEDLGSLLYGALMKGEAEIAVAHDGTRMQPVFALLRRDLRSSLLRFLAEDEHKIDLWFRRHKVATADFSGRLDTFLNINTPQQCAALASRLALRR